MKRKAILIATPGCGTNVASGTLVDIAAWEAYLKSNKGGAWNDDEFVPLQNPSKQQLDEALASADSCDYTVITFSGHGSVDLFEGDPTTMLNICPTEPPMPYYYLKSHGNRTLLIIDSCRYDINGLFTMSKSANLSSILNEAVESLEHDDYRRIYEQAILKTERGVITMFGCDFGEEAEDELDENTPGGLYTLSLIKVAQDWFPLAKNNTLLTVCDAHLVAARDVSQKNSEQHPKIHHGRRLGIFPLAIKA